MITRNVVTPTAPMAGNSDLANAVPNWVENIAPSIAATAGAAAVALRRAGGEATVKVALVDGIRRGRLRRRERLSSRASPAR